MKQIRGWVVHLQRKGRKIVDRVAKKNTRSHAVFLIIVNKIPGLETRDDFNLVQWRISLFWALRSIFPDPFSSCWAPFQWLIKSFGRRPLGLGRIGLMDKVALAWHLMP